MASAASTNPTGSSAPTNWPSGSVPPSAARTNITSPSPRMSPEPALGGDRRAQHLPQARRDLHRLVVRQDPDVGADDLRVVEAHHRDGRVAVEQPPHDL